MEPAVSWEVGVSGGGSDRPTPLVRQDAPDDMFIRSLALCAALALAAGAASAQTPTRIRGTIIAIAGTEVHVMPNGGGDDLVAVSPATKVTLVSPTTLATVQPGSFIGTAARMQDDGTMVAVEVHVFPESMRGAGEGHRPFDLGPRSTMTNGTVGQEVVGKAGQTLTVRYKGGEKAVLVPTDTPVVALAQADLAALVPGARVIVLTQPAAGGALSAVNVVVGANGMTPPM